MTFPTRSATINGNGFAVLKSTAAAAGITLGALSEVDAIALCVANLLEGTPSGTVGAFGVLTATGAINLGSAALAPPKTAATVASLGTTQNSTPTAAQLLGGIVTQTGQTGGGTVTTPTGATLSAAISDVAVGMVFKCLFANLGGGQTLTITAGATGMTVVGTAAIGSGKNAWLTFLNTATDTWTCYVNVSA